MILHKQRLVYLHPTKTAGCAIEQALFEREMILCGVEIPDKQQQIYEAGGLPLHQCTMYGVNDKISSSHWSLLEIHEAYPFTKGWGVVISVRCPYSRAISEFKYQRAGNGRVNHHWSPDDFEDAVVSGDLFRNGYPRHMRSQASYTPHGAPVKLLRYERLRDDFTSLFPNTRLQVVNQSGPVSIALTEKAKKSIRDVWGEDFQRFGYPE